MYAQPTPHRQHTGAHSRAHNSLRPYAFNSSPAHVLPDGWRNAPSSELLAWGVTVERPLAAVAGQRARLRVRAATSREAYRGAFIAEACVGHYTAELLTADTLVDAISRADSDPSNFIDMLADEVRDAVGVIDVWDVRAADRLQWLL